MACAWRRSCPLDGCSCFACSGSHRWPARPRRRRCPGWWRAASCSRCCAEPRWPFTRPTDVPCTGWAAPTGPIRPAARTPVDARDRAFDLLGVPESARDSQAAEDLLEEEATLAERRAAVPGRASLEEAGSPALAAPAPGGLVVIAGGVGYRVAAHRGAGAPGTGARGCGGAGRHRGGRCAVVAGPRPELLTSAGGSTWRVAMRERGPIDQLVGSPRGWLAWSSGDTLTIARVADRDGGREYGGDRRTVFWRRPACDRWRPAEMTC